MAGNITVTVRGPLFDSDPEGVVQAALEDLTASIANQGQAIIKSKAAKFNKSGRGGSGAAADAVTTRVESTTAVITGQSSKGEAWWPWLEGTSKRNQSTRFKGYFTFRLATGVMRKRMRAQAPKVIAGACAKLGGDQ